MVDRSDLDSLLPWATPAERQAVELLKIHGTHAAVARELGVTKQAIDARIANLKKRAARSGWSPEHDMEHPAPAGFHVKGVSTLYVTDELTGEARISQQWVKTKSDGEHRLEMLAAAIETLVEPIRGLHSPTPAPIDLANDLLAVYPIGDPHFGMHAWAEECGDSFDLKIAERLLVGAVEHLVELARRGAPAAETALIILAGDTFHADNKDAKTARSGHALDVDTRWAKVLGVVVQCFVWMIKRALDVHAKVLVRVEIGNHDDQSAIMLAAALAAYFHAEPRVHVDQSPAKFWYFRFGRCLLGTTHGDTVKFVKLGGIMATDVPEDWGATHHRHWYCGHVHHESVIEMPGCTAETLRTLASRDAYAAGAGYRSGRDMRLDIWHRERGRINRHFVGVEELKANWGK